LLGALIFALFLVPVLASFFFRRGYTEWENPLLRWSRPIYARILRNLLHYRWVVAITAITLLGGIIVIIVPRLGIEFLPYMDEGVVWVRANFPEGTSLEKTSAYGAEIRKILLEYPDIKTVSVQAGRNDSGTDPFPPSRLEMMVIPKPREEWTTFKTKREMLLGIGGRLRKEFPTTRFNFTQPIIDSVTEDTNGTSADLAVEFTGPDSNELLKLARRGVELLKKVPGAMDVNIEQEGPQPQLLIVPDRAKCARYNVRIEDVTRLINTAMGGEPIGSLFEGEKKFDIVVKFDRKYMNSEEAVKRLPVNTQGGTAVPLADVATIETVDGQTLIAREGGRRRLTVRCDIVGRDQGGFVAEAQELFETEITVPEGYRMNWLGMFENLERARKHFFVLIPVSIAVIFGLLVFTFKSYRAAILLLSLVPFSFVGGALALYFRGMNLNVSTGVGFAALFGVSLMDGVLMVKAITSLRQRENTLDDAIVQGALSRIRPILMTALVAMLGLLPASLSTGLGSDVQRPLATVIVWGLFSAMLLTLFVVPVSYRIFAPPLPKAPAAEPSDVAEFVEPLPDVSAVDVVAIIEYLAHQRGETDVFRMAGETHREFNQTVAIVKAAEMLDLVETPGQKVILTGLGQSFAQATPEDRKTLWRQQLLMLGLFRELYDIVRQQPERAIDRDFVLETIVFRMPYENYERVFNTLIRWSRFGELFVYDEGTQQLRLGEKVT
ncbi:MAG TPA: efflux RND transporter permease subunit, partial [Gemmataceae bacterium]|nr:efflux RND transporter permease subunit [Gemmataceae bacterium]